MPRERKKVLCMDAQRHAEYYGMQRTLDELYAKSKAGETFTGLMELVLSPDNIMLAYASGLITLPDGMMEAEAAADPDDADVEGMEDGEDEA